MTRSLVLPLLVISCAVGGFLFVRQSRTVASDFEAVSVRLEAWHAGHGTYAGITLPRALATTVVRADATSYCVESGGEHLDGPGGTPKPGPC